MKLIDLTLFAEHSQKLPGSYLEPKIKKETSSWNILGIHIMDFTIAYIITNLITLFLTESASMIMTIYGMEKAFPYNQVMGFSSKLLPLVTFSYFFFLYFMNNGQTVGMRAFKKRVSLPQQSFRESFQWALRSFLLCATGGISFLFSWNKWEKLETHDYLYENLLSTKEYAPINLLAEIESFENKEEGLENWQQVA